MKILPASLEKYEHFIRGADAKTLFSETEQLELISQGIIKLAAEDASEASLALLSLFIRDSTDPVLIEDCYAVLSNLSQQGNQRAIETLFELSLLYHLSPASKIIQALHLHSSLNAKNALFYLSTGQVTDLYALKRMLYNLQSYYLKASLADRELMIEWAQKAALLDWSSTIDFLESLQPTTFENGQKIYLSLTVSSKRFFLGQLIRKVVEQQAPALEFAISLYIKTAEPILKHSLNHISAEQFPAEQYALFLLMDEQWLKYLAYDPGSKYLQQLYAQMDGEIQAKIIQKTRAAGIDFLVSSTNQHKPIGISELSFADWKMISQTLRNTGDTARIWQLVQLAPPYWSAVLLQYLMDLDWKPEQSDELTFYNTLINGMPEISLPVKESLLITDSTLQLEQSPVILTKQNTNMACYSDATQSITLYKEFPLSISYAHVIFPPRPVISAAGFSPDGRYLCWADIDQQINIYDSQQDKIVKRFAAHSNRIRSILISNDQRYLYSTGFDGLVQSWRFPDGSFEKTLYESQNEIYDMVFSTTDELLMTADIAGEIHVFSTSHMAYVLSMKANPSPILHLSNPSQGIIAAASAENFIYVWNYRSGKLLAQLQLQQSQDKISALQLSSSAQFLYATMSSGELFIIDPLSGTLYEGSSIEHSPVQKLEITADEISLFYRNGKAHLMKNFFWQQIMRPINNPENQRLKRITEIQSNPVLTAEQNKWLDYTKSLLHWQKRYDIDIEILQSPITFDDFSIVL